MLPIIEEKLLSRQPEKKKAIIISLIMGSLHKKSIAVVPEIVNKYMALANHIMLVLPYACTCVRMLVVRGNKRGGLSLFRKFGFRFFSKPFSDTPGGEEWL